MKSACGELTTTFMSAGLPGTVEKIKNAIETSTFKIIGQILLSAWFHNFQFEIPKNFTIFLRLAVSYRRSHSIADSCECQHLNRVIRVLSQTGENSGQSASLSYLKQGNVEEAHSRSFSK